MCEFVSLRNMCQEIISEFKLTSTDISLIKSKIFEDNNGCIATAEAPKLTPRTKHTVIKFHFIRNYFGKNPTRTDHFKHPFELRKVDTHEQKGDIFTKGLKKDTFLILEINNNL